MESTSQALSRRVQIYERRAQEALDAACAATDPYAQRNWNLIAEGWLKLAEHSHALCRQDCSA